MPGLEDAFAWLTVVIEEQRRVAARPDVPVAELLAEPADDAFVQVVGEVVGDPQRLVGLLPQLGYVTTALLVELAKLKGTTPEAELQALAQRLA